MSPACCLNASSLSRRVLLARFLFDESQTHQFMKATVFMIIAAIICIRLMAQETFATRSGRITFFSEAPIADVDATNNKVYIVLNTATNALDVSANMHDFQFRNEKMGRDAERDYIEIDEHPKTSFKGTLKGEINYDKPGTYNAVATGRLNIHGNERDVSEKGTVTVRDGRVVLNCQFKVALDDYRIETPKILGKEMTEDTVLVTLEASLEPQRDAASKK